MNVCPVVLAGGFGERLFPISTKELPKQFIKFCYSDESLFERTIKRIRLFLKSETILVVCNKIHVNLCEEQMSRLGEENYLLILEQEKKNTMISLLLALKVLQNSDTDILFVSPTDSFIEDVEKFAQCCNIACESSFLLRKHVLFGIKPTDANTNYGYICLGKQLEDVENNLFDVKDFYEKPEESVVSAFLKKNNVLWNSGSFAFNYHVLIKALSADHAKYVDFLKNVHFTYSKTGKIIEADEGCLSKVNSAQIDRTIIEHRQSYKNFACIKANFDWCDIGTMEILDRLRNTGKIVI